MAGVVAVEITGGPEIPFHPGRPVSEPHFLNALLSILLNYMHWFGREIVDHVSRIIYIENLLMSLILSLAACLGLNLELCFCL